MKQLKLEHALLQLNASASSTVTYSSCDRFTLQTIYSIINSKVEHVNTKQSHAIHTQSNADIYSSIFKHSSISAMFK